MQNLTNQVENLEKILLRKMHLTKIIILEINIVRHAYYYDLASTQGRPVCAQVSCFSVYTLTEDREKSRSDRITCRTLTAPGRKRLNKSVNLPKTTLNGITFAALIFTSANILTLRDQGYPLFQIYF